MRPFGSRRPTIDTPLYVLDLSSRDGVNGIPCSLRACFRNEWMAEDVLNPNSRNNASHFSLNSGSTLIVMLASFILDTSLHMSITIADKR